MSKADRSALMSRIRCTDTRPELRVKALANATGRAWRPNDPALPGKPDVAFHGAKLAVFMHGCFWHRHDCSAGRRTPATNPTFWADKFRANKRRDARYTRALRAAGWRTLVVWECRLRDAEAVARRMRRALCNS